MKKLFIIFFVLLFSTHTQALVLENCYVAEKNNKSVDTSFRKDQFEKNEFRVFSEGKIRQTMIATDKFLNEVNERRKKFRKKEKEKYGHDIGDYSAEKIYTKIFKITYFDKKFVKAERSQTYTSDSLGETKINLNITDGSIRETHTTKFRGKAIMSDTTIHKCVVSKSSSKSNFLDYWWAVILIIAITFFIFTQSGKRLKQIRRK